MDDYEARKAYQNPAEAETYDAERFGNWRGKIRNALDKRTLSKALAMLSQSQPLPLRILDIPCGTGRMTRFLLEQGHYVVGTDISQEMMQVAQAKVAGFDTFGGFYQSDAANLDFEDNSFDCVVSIRFMGHIPSDVRARILAEFYRVGRNAIIEFSLKSQAAMLRRQVEHHLGIGLPLPQRWPWRIFEKQELHVELKEAGFRIVRMWPKMRYLSDSWYVLVQRGNSQQ